MHQVVTGRIDSHAHVFNLALPMVAGRRYTPAQSAPLENYLAHLHGLGCTHGVLIQPSFLGCDNSFMLQAIAQAGPRLRGVACVDPTITLPELQAMDRAGIVGIRLNVIDGTQPQLQSALWQNLLYKIKRLNWHVELHCRSNKLDTMITTLLKHQIRVVVDHFGRPADGVPARDNGFQRLLQWGHSGMVWCKLSAVYRISAAAADGHKFFAAAIPLLLENFGSHRLMWGSDWPHTQYEQQINPEYLATQLNMLLQDKQLAPALLWDTPAKLFRFIQNFV
jgi:predicted TIM-barrel fold metal-dependent hydrolase